MKPFSRPAQLLLALAGVALLASCGEGGGSIEETPSGSLTVLVQTSGSQRDPNGFTLSIGALGDSAVGINDTLHADVAPGTYLAMDGGDLPPATIPLTLSGVASNCDVEVDGIPAIVTDGGAATLGFTVSCDSTFGGITVNTTTTGGTPDPNGYQVEIDGVTKGTVPATGSLKVEGIATGIRVVHLTGLAGNCSSGDVTDTLALGPGGNPATNFAVSCPTPASITVDVTSSGVAIDPDGYQVLIDGVPSAATVNDTIGPVAVTAGPHVVALRSVVMNCAVAGDSTRNFSLTEGGAQHETFTVTCAMPPVAYAHADTGAAGFGIWRMNPDGTNPLPVIPFVGVLTGGRAPAWSPDRQKFAFQRPSNFGSALAIANADGTGIVTILDSMGVSALRWSPDGTKILFRGHPAGTNDNRFTRMWVVGTDGSDPHLLVTDSLGEFGGDWSPTGDRVAFTRYQPNGAPSGLSELVLLDVSSGTETVIPTDTLAPSWSTRWRPNSEQIAFQCFLLEVCVVNSDGTGLALVQAPAGPQNTFNWSLDGSLLLWSFARIDGGGALRIEYGRMDWATKTWTTFPYAAAARVEPAW